MADNKLLYNCMLITIYCYSQHYIEEAMLDTEADTAEHCHCLILPSHCRTFRKPKDVNVMLLTNWKEHGKILEWDLIAQGEQQRHFVTRKRVFQS